MAKGLWSKIIQGALIGGGTLLSVLSAGALAPVGVALIGAGIAVPSGTNDNVSAVANQIGVALGAGASQASATTTNITISRFLNWVQSNIMLILIGVAALVVIPKLIPKLFKRRRR